MILFKYTPNNIEFLNMIVKNIVNYSKPYFEGILDESYQNILINPESRKLKIYLVCELIEGQNGMFYKNPMAVVAYNESEAVGFYTDWKSNFGSVLCILEHDASKAKVEPLDE